MQQSYFSPDRPFVQSSTISDQRARLQTPSLVELVNPVIDRMREHTAATNLARSARRHRQRKKKQRTGMACPS
jgi:hypothetical protein